MKLLDVDEPSTRCIPHVIILYSKYCTLCTTILQGPRIRRDCQDFGVAVTASPKVPSKQIYKFILPKCTLYTESRTSSFSKIRAFPACVQATYRYELLQPRYITAVVVGRRMAGAILDYNIPYTSISSLCLYSTTYSKPH